MIEFESLGGVGDGDPVTGKGTDNARAFARAEVMAQQGYGIKFKAKACYKTSEQINVHDMYWIGDEIFNPVIFGWFSKKGKKIIGRSRKNEPVTVCIIGLTFHRCGPYAEHGIVVDNIKSLYFNGAVTSRPGAQGGAIGISPFFPERRHSRNCFIKARINNSGDFGVQLGSVSGAVLDVTAKNCYREVIGIEPVVYGNITLNGSDISGNNIYIKDANLSNGDVLLYCSGDKARGHFFPGKKYFIIKNNDRTFSLSESYASYLEGKKLDLDALNGIHYFVKSCIVEDVSVIRANIVDNTAKKPTLYANTNGYIIVTGNSGGYIRNIKFNDIYIEGNQIYPAGKSVGVYVEGVENLIIENIKIRGCDDAIIISDGWLNGMFDEGGIGIHIEKGYAKILSKKISVINPDLIDFRNHGIIFKGNGGTLYGGNFRSALKNAKPVVRE